MVQIDPPVLPPRLFRYRNVCSMELAKQELEAISKNYLWCCHYRDLNDPMEGIFGVSVWLTEQPTFEPLAREILDQRDEVGICCFSDTGTNELMWAHYAENFSGICVAYSTRQLRDGIGDDVHFVRVAYDELPPRLGRDDQKCPQRAARRILSHKKSCWLYEREWRLLTSPKTMQVPGPLKITVEPSVKAVFLGPRMKDEVRTKLVEELTKMNIDIHTVKVSGYERKWARCNTSGGAA